MADFLLIHGAWHGSWCWDRVRPILEEAGHRVVAPTLSGLEQQRTETVEGIDLTTHVDDVVGAALDLESDDLILVGHSYAGFVTTGAADRLRDAVSLYVYLDAGLPAGMDPGSSFAWSDSLSPKRKQERLDAITDLGLGPVLPPPPPEAFGVESARAIELRDVDRWFGEQIVLLGACATIMHGERVGVIGPNGAGKSVLLRLIMGLLPLDGGEIWIGPSIMPGYYAQHHETLDPAQTPIEALRAVRPMTEGEAVARLGRFLIPYVATTQPVSRLSGGEKSRVQLARLMISGANCLLLDEPTNHLDIPSAEVLEHALETFSGTVVVVSHDRYLLDRVADRIFEVGDGMVRVHEGGYSFAAAQRARRLALPAASPSTATRSSRTSR
jgi:ABC-type cobalamin/Fe3+-siderophores transport system ATPase subunit